MARGVIQANVQTAGGFIQVAPNADVSITVSSTGGAATLYDAREGGSTVVNPTTADINGFFRVYVAPGRYDIAATYGGATQTFKDVPIFSEGIEHSAENITYSNTTSGLVAEDAQAAIDEIDANLDSHLADPSDAHDASAVSVVDTGGYYAGIEVESVLQEVGASLSGIAINYFQETRNTAAPNATIPAHQWSVFGAETDIDAVFSPKGGGAILAQVPDGIAAGGDKRGDNAVDLQVARSSPGQVAAGLRAVIGGGDSNTASGARSSVSGGTFNDLSGLLSCCPGGGYATDRGISCRQVFASGTFSSVGDAQIAVGVQRAQTTDATATTLTYNGGGKTATSVFVLPDNYTYAATARISARDVATGDSADFEIKGTAKRGTGAASTALVGTPTLTTIVRDSGAAGWGVELIADTTLGAVEIQVTGEAATTIHWVCKFETVEVG